jgi:TIR domain
VGDSRESNRAHAVFFISYAGPDVAWAEWIAWQLEAAGHKTISQVWDFQAGTHFVDEMHRATQETRTIAVLSRSYLNSAFATEEWQAAWASDPSGRAGRLLVVRVEECDRPGLLRQLVSVDVFGTTPEVAKERLLSLSEQRIDHRG